MSDEEEATLNIGALSVATGVPVETIRTWERRYGFPQSSRNDAGHRIYELAAIEHLRLITSILDQGYRPSQLAGCSCEELEALLVKSTGGDQHRAFSEDCGVWLQCWSEAVSDLDRQRFERQLRAEYGQMSALNFLDHRLSPFLTELGHEWAAGNFGVVHEHFASECIRDFLAALWRPLSATARGATVILTTFSGEEHCLGLHMASLAVSMAERRVVFLGTNMPVDEIVSAVAKTGAATVALSISTNVDEERARSCLTQLRESLGSSVEILVGGGGAPDEAPGTAVIPSLKGLYDYLAGDQA